MFPSCNFLHTVVAAIIPHVAETCANGVEILLRSVPSRKYRLSEKKAILDLHSMGLQRVDLIIIKLLHNRRSAQNKRCLFILQC
ncbi:hypothetical protein TNIN_237101 [Trichonephila inaurata madagascariensis]|uniref:Uncharacterized protein n=1 Tax=Trichonephila inaurata madagascariensis TaxID=2747483 RepID=A0A8X7CEA7_9ARAC|nr:hypothetical protein TNIN_237101 [Trichonephila inaurata madagascariensis]